MIAVYDQHRLQPRVSDCVQQALGYPGGYHHGQTTVDTQTHNVVDGAKLLNQLLELPVACDKWVTTAENNFGDIRSCGNIVNRLPPLFSAIAIFTVREVSPEPRSNKMWGLF